MMNKESISGKNNKIFISPSIKDKVNITVNGNSNKITIDENVIVKSYLNINIQGSNCTVNIKNGTTFEGTNILLAENDNYIIIGEDCMFALNTCILASDFHSIIDCKSGKRINTQKGVKLNNHIWVATNALILKNTSVGSNTVIGAGSIVSGNLPNNCIVCGIPAKVVKKNINWARELLNNDSDFLIPKKIIDENITFNIESDIKKYNNFIVGWAFIENKTSIDDKMLFMVTTRKGKKLYFPGYKYDSKDVADYFHNPNYGHSRFKFFINLELKEIKEIKIIIIKHDVGYSKTIYKSGSEVK